MPENRQSLQTAELICSCTCNCGRSIPAKNINPHEHAAAGAHEDPCLLGQMEQAGRTSMFCLNQKAAPVSVMLPNKQRSLADAGLSWLKQLAAAAWASKQA